jgi:cell division protein FtsB
MREFQEKKRFKKLLYSKTTVAILGIFIIFFANATWGVYKKERESSANAVNAKKELEHLTDRKILLNKETKRLSTEQGIEEEIRAKYSVSKPGESVIIIVNDKEAATTTVQNQDSWWGKFKKWFK